MIITIVSLVLSTAYVVIIYRLGSLIIYLGGPPIAFVVWVFVGLGAGVVVLAVCLKRATGNSRGWCG